MEKSMMFSKAAILAFLLVIGACVPFSQAARAPALDELQSEPAPVDDVPSPNLYKCSTYKDCKGITCDSVDSVIWHVECVNGSCHCIPNETSRAPAPVDLQSEPAPVDDLPPQTEAVELCSSDDDCHLPICTEYVGSHLKCVAGRCRCVVITEPPKTS